MNIDEARKVNRWKGRKNGRGGGGRLPIRKHRSRRKTTEEKIAEKCKRRELSPEKSGKK